MARPEHMRIPFPGSGVHADLPHGDQPPGTTADALNVRTIDPWSGRSTGARRSGLTRYIANALEAGEPVVRLTAVARSRTRLTHTQLTETDNSTTVPPEIAVEWARRTPRGGPARALAIDSQANSYVLDGPGTLVKYNADGREVLQASLPANANDTVAQAVGLGGGGAVYVASSNLDGSQGKVWRYLPDTQDETRERLALDWTLTLDKGVRNLVVDSDVLYLYLYGEDNPAAEIAAYFALSATSPTLGWRRPCPDPVNDMSLAADGGLLLAIGRNLRRAAGFAEPNRTTKFTAPWPYGPMWNPHDLPQARERLYGWWSARTLASQDGTLEDGDEVLRWPSRVNFDTSAGAGLGNYPSVYDDTPRDFFTETSGGAALHRHGPTYRSKGSGGVPCLDFDSERATIAGTGPPGEVLFTETNLNATAKTNVQDKLPDQRSLFPGWTSARYCVVMAIRVRRRSQIGVLLSHLGGAPASGGPATSYGVLVNGVQLTGGPSIANRAINEGRISLDVGARNAGDYSATSHFSYNRVTLGDGPQTGAGDLADGTSEDESLGAIITLNINDTPAASSLRVNGVHLDNFTMGATPSWGGGPSPLNAAYAILGSMAPRDSQFQRSSGNTTDTNVYGRATAYGSFDGEVLEIITVLGSSSSPSNPHDTALTAPALGQGTNPGTEPPVLVRDYPDEATEIERLEGYIAHANGLSHVLSNGQNQFFTVSGLAADRASANHPFGGTGEFPVSPEFPGEAVSEQDLWTSDAKIAKLNPASGASEWVLRAAGTGHAVAGDGTRGVGSVGEDLPQPPITSVEWASRRNEEQIVLRRVTDLGYTYAIAARSKGLIHVQSQPAEGATLIVDDGRGPVTFTFTSSPSLPTDIQRNLSVSVQAQNIHTALINPSNGFFALMVGLGTVLVVGDQVGIAGNNPMSGTAGVAGTLLLDGMRDGREPDGAWEVLEADPNQRPVGATSRIEADQDNDFHVLWHTSNNMDRLRKYLGADGTLVWTYDLGSSRTGYALAPRFRTFEFNPDTVRGPEFLLVGHDDGGAGAGTTLTLLRLVAEEIDLTSTASPRAITALGVANGTIYTFSVFGSSTPTGGSSALDAGSSFIDSAALFGEVFFTDGRRYKVFSAKTGEVTDFEAKTGGEIPKGARLMAAWNGRLVVARTREDGHGVYMSAQSDPYDWDLFPAVVVPTQAVSLPASLLGKCPDIINALVSYSDDLLLLLCDSSIWRLTGDPMIGGQLDLVSDITGGAFGRSWCKDPEGRLYFFGSRGGVYVFAGAGAPESLTRHRIERRLNNVDLTAVRVELVWNVYDEGLHVFLFNIGEFGFAREHWFWDQKNNAWWPDGFGNFQGEVSVENRQPSAVMVLDGDEPSDRVLLLGGEDGRIRYWNASAKSDDEVPISSRVKIGPLAPAETPLETKFSRLQVTLAPKRSGCMAEMLVGDTAAEGGRVVARFPVAPGRNAARHERAAGGYAWLKLYSAVAGDAWAFEAATMDVGVGGRRRVRR